MDHLKGKIEGVQNCRSSSLFSLTHSKMDFRSLARLQEGMSLRGVNTGAVLFGGLMLLGRVLAKQRCGSRLISSHSYRTLSSHEQSELIQTWQEKDGVDRWLEAVDSEEALNWVKTQNKACFESLGTPQESELFDKALKILDNKEKIPHVTKIGDFYYNFWTDETNPRGLLRRTTLLKYKSKEPKWEVVLDIDALGKAEGESWVYKGYELYKPDPSTGEDVSTLCRVLLRLSRGGADATVVREFDMLKGKFVAGGFEMPEAKSYCRWKDLNTLIIGTDFGEGSMTDSGYPRTVREWKRGTELHEAKQIQEGDQTDVGVMGYITKHKGYKFQFCHFSHTFYTNSLLIKLPMGSWIKVPKPEDATVSVFADKFLISLRSDWTVGGEVTHPSGSLITVDIKELIQKAENSNFTVLFTPTERCSLEGYTITNNFVVLETLDNVLSRVIFWRHSKDRGWVLSSEEEKPAIRGVSFRAVDEDTNDYLWMTTYSFLNTTRLSMVDARNGAAGLAGAKQLKALPDMFDSEGLVEEQFEAVSEDGTKIPYFMVYKKGATMDGSNPTLLYGYGGFEISMTPGYAAIVGKMWLEKGGIYAVANIRGGGEFGPRWHQAALKANRKLAYDDFIAVGEDLVRRKVTSPRRLGIRGGSNGGLLMGNMITRRPDLWGAVVCQVPLLDMFRYNKLLAGASWMAEYGNPDIAEEWAYLQKYSAYHNIDPQAQYPPLLMTTSTRDDRVHPYHARSFVKRMLEVAAKNGAAPNSVLYYENIEGGHGGAADSRQQAEAQTLVYGFLWDVLSR